MTKHQWSAVGETATRVRRIGWRAVQGREQRWGTEAVIESEPFFAELAAAGIPTQVSVTHML